MSIRLQPVAGSPGRWRNPAWTEGSPGAFAVVIGVSAYTHLHGVPGQPPHGNFGLGKLSVSALTAQRFFTWLADDFEQQGCPIAEVWLLLAPTAVEAAMLPHRFEHFAAPTMDGCRAAIRACFAALQALPPAAAKASQSFFFFSGHGLEIQRDKQVLLPVDYLAPPGAFINDALSTADLVGGLAGLAVARHFFFIDACRNDIAELRDRGLEGTAVLAPVPSHRTNRDHVAPIFYASAAGTQAWSPADPKGGLSVFGDALLAGLRAESGYHPPPPGPVLVFDLYRDLTRRIARRIAGEVWQVLRLGGTIADVRIAEVSALTEPPAPQKQHRGVTPSAPGPYRVLRGAPSFPAFRVYSPASRSWSTIPGAAIDCRDRPTGEGSKDLRITLTGVHDSGPLWLEIRGRTGPAFGCLLPAADPLRPIWAIEARIDGEGVLSRVQVLLADDNAGALGDAARLWDRYRKQSIGEAAELLRNESRALLTVLGSKAESPLAATIAAAILVRGHRVLADREPDLARTTTTWLRNLADWFPWIPDGLVLYRQQLRGTGETNDDPSLALAQLATRDLPALAEPLAYLGALLDSELDVPHVALEPLQHRVRLALARSRPGGLFTVYSGPPDELGPALVLAD